MPKATPIYSAFGLVAIESIWPSSNGDEVPINYLDLSFLRERLLSDENPDFEIAQQALRNDQETLNEDVNRINNELLSRVNSEEITRFSVSRYEERLLGPREGTPEEIQESIPDSVQTSTRIWYGPTSFTREDDFNILGYGRQVFTGENEEPEIEDVVFNFQRTSFQEAAFDPDSFSQTGLTDEEFQEFVSSTDIYDVSIYQIDSEGNPVLSDELAATFAKSKVNFDRYYTNEIVSSVTLEGVATSRLLLNLLNSARKGRSSALAGPLADRGAVPTTTTLGQEVEIFNAYNNYKNGSITLSELDNQLNSIYQNLASRFDSEQEALRTYYADNLEGYEESYIQENPFPEEPPAFEPLEVPPVIQEEEAEEELDFEFNQPEAVNKLELAKTKVNFSNEVNIYNEISSILQSNERLLELFSEDGLYSFENIIETGISNIIIDSRVFGGSDTQTAVRSAYDAYVELLSAEIESQKSLLQEDIFQSAKNSQDELDYVNARVLETDAYGIYPEANIRPGFSSILRSDDAFKKRRGYFKILPLNILSISSNTSTGGEVGQSQFEVSFTLDDVIIIADDFASQMIYNSMPRAIPISLANVETEIRAIYNQSVPEEIQTELSPYGYTAFRVSGNDFPFNIEDIVEANDTVTIWLYHDPKEFDFVENETLSLDEFVFNKSFSYVVGTASRKSQDDFNLRQEQTSSYTPPKTRVQSILNDAGILSKYNSPEKLQEFVDNSEVDLRLSPSETFEFLFSSGSSANLLGFSGAGLNQNDFTRGDSAVNVSVDNLVDLMLSNPDSAIFQEQFKNNLFFMFAPEVPNQEDSNASIISSRTFSAAFINSVRDTLQNSSNEESYVDYWNSNHANTVVENGNELSSVYKSQEVEDFFNFLETFTGTVSSLTQDGLRFLAEQNITEIKDATRGFPEGKFYKRKTLISRSHGETPYLVLKGHVSEISSRYGASTGSNSVSLKGKGYEKILQDNTVYYEDLFSPTGGSFAQATEGYPIYSQILPPRAMLHFIEMHSPRFLIVGQPSSKHIDTRKMSLYFALTRNDFIKKENSDEEGQNDTEIEQPKNLWERYFSNDKVLIRGLGAVNINTSGDVTQTEDGDEVQEYTASLRLFYPVNYLNTSRIREMITALTEAYFENIEEATIKIPFTPASGQSVANNLVGFNGPQEINHLFVDETGRLRQRLAFEAWERTPSPEYTPTILDTDILDNGSTFSRNSNPIATMVDVRTNTQGTSLGIVDARFAGRTLSQGNDYIPMVTLNEGTSNFLNLNENLFSNDYEVISEAFFRYGMRYRRINDIYTSSTRVAQRKSLLYHGFFSKPIKTANVTVKGNSAYRVGETVLVSLNSYRYRSREIVDVAKTLDWLRYLKENKELIPLYIGADKRWSNYDFYHATSSLNENPSYSYWLQDFSQNPEEYILDRFIETFEYLESQLTGSLKFITPEYFPTTYWAFSGSRSPNFGDGIQPVSIRSAYNILYNQLTGKSSNSFKNIIDRRPSILRAIRMQTFKATSYYIDAVRHNYIHGQSFTTNLTLNHGQDNLVLIEPYSMKPIGFMSIERKMRIGYDDIVLNEDGQVVYPQEPEKNTRDRKLWEEFPNPGSQGKFSDLQRTYISQFNQDKIFKQSSFLYESQKTRNSSNFMYEINLDNNV